MWNGPSLPDALRAPGALGAPEGPQLRDPEIHTRAWYGNLERKTPGHGVWAPGAPGAPAGALST